MEITVKSKSASGWYNIIVRADTPYGAVVKKCFGRRYKTSGHRVYYLAWHDGYQRYAKSGHSQRFAERPDYEELHAAVMDALDEYDRAGKAFARAVKKV